MYLEQLQFNINVASSTYAQYYFDLRSLAEDNGLSFPNEYEALTKERAKQLEVGNNWNKKLKQALCFVCLCVCVCVCVCCMCMHACVVCVHVYVYTCTCS